MASTDTSTDVSGGPSWSQSNSQPSSPPSSSLASMISVELGLVGRADRARPRCGRRQPVRPRSRPGLARVRRELRLDRADLPRRRRDRSRTTSANGSGPRSASGSSRLSGRSWSPALVAYGLLDWSVKASLIAGTALSTTSLAVIYAVLVETGLNATRIGKLIMSACFVTDMATALALSAIFIKPNAWFPVFLVVSVGLIVALPKIAPWFFRRYGDRVIEPEIKLVFVCLFVLMVLADAAKGHAVLPAFVLGLVMARHYQQHRQEQERLRVVAFAFLTPFFFLRGGLNVSLGAVFANLGLLALLFAAKMVPKIGLDLPARAAPRPRARDLHDAADEHRPHVRDDLLALRSERRDHRPHAVLAAGHGRRAFGDRADGDRPTLVLARRRGRARCRSASFCPSRSLPRSTSRKPLAPGIEADQEASGLGRLLDHRRVARPGDDRHADPEFAGGRRPPPREAARRGGRRGRRSRAGGPAPTSGRPRNAPRRRSRPTRRRSSCRPCR